MVNDYYLPATTFLRSFFVLFSVEMPVFRPFLQSSSEHAICLSLDLYRQTDPYALPLKLNISHPVSKQLVVLLKTENNLMI